MSRPIFPLTSLLLVEERLLEADYFVRLMRRGRGAEFGYCLHAFVSASRSVTFLIQKEMARVPGFKAWWSEQQQLMLSDEAMRFFLKLRNYSQKEGRISLIGIRCGTGSRSRWSHRFAGTDDRVPAVLLHQDVTDCCIEHLAKLAKVVLGCTERFPFHTCPRMALSLKGAQELRLSIQDLAVALGLYRRWEDSAAGIPLEQQLRMLQDHVDGLNILKLKQLARRSPRNRNRSHVNDSFGEALCRVMIDQLESERTVHTLNIAGELLLRT